MTCEAADVALSVGEAREGHTLKRHPSLILPGAQPAVKADCAVGGASSCRATGALHSAERQENRTSPQCTPARHPTVACPPRKKMKITNHPTTCAPHAPQQNVPHPWLENDVAFWLSPEWSPPTTSQYELVVSAPTCLKIRFFCKKCLRCMKTSQSHPACTRWLEFPAPGFFSECWRNGWISPSPGPQQAP